MKKIRKKERTINLITMIWFITVLLIIPTLLIVSYLKFQSAVFKHYTTETSLDAAVGSGKIEKMLENLTESSYEISSEIDMLFQNSILTEVNILNTIERELNKIKDIDSVSVKLKKDVFSVKTATAASDIADRFYATTILRNGDTFITASDDLVLNKTIQCESVKSNGTFFVNNKQISGTTKHTHLSFVVPVYIQSELAGWVETEITSEKISGELKNIGTNFETAKILDSNGDELSFEQNGINIFTGIETSDTAKIKTLFKEKTPFTIEYKDSKKNIIRLATFSPVNNNTSAVQWWLLLSNPKNTSLPDSLGIRSFFTIFLLVIVVLFIVTCTLLYILLKKVLKNNNQLYSLVNRLRKTQKELVVKERMASLGSLVKGISHELNTPIGVCVTAVSYLKNDMGDIESFNYPDEIVEKFKQVDEAVNIIHTNLTRSINLINGFKEILHEDSPGDFYQFRVKEFLDTLFVVNYELLKNIKHKISLQCEYNLFVKSYPKVLMKVITILLKNSIIHAFTGIVGVIKISAYIDEKTNTFILEYSDNGKGLNPEIIERIFDPFFTTSRSSGCTGLGLTVAHSLVTNHLHGTIECVNQKDSGAKFLIQIPNIEYHFDL